MKQTLLTLCENTALTADVYRLRLAGDVSAVTAPGQFVNVRLDGFYLRRPISVCDWDGESLTLICKVLGRGMQAMTALPVGAKLDVLVGLGNGFDEAPCGGRPMLVGGGVGVAPLYGLAKRLCRAGKRVTAVLGYNSRADEFLVDDFRALGAETIVATADGSDGVCGFVTDAMPSDAGTHLYACGPEAMLRAVYDACGTDGQFSFEERMGCGFGACMGCSCETKYGSKRICKDGPVLRREEIVW